MEIRKTTLYYELIYLSNFVYLITNFKDTNYFAIFSMYINYPFLFDALEDVYKKNKNNFDS